MVPLGATPRKRKYTLSTATPHCLPPTFTARQWFTGVLRRRRWLSLRTLRRNVSLPREEAPGTNHNGKRASWPRASALRLRAGPTQHLSRTEGVILDPGEAGGDRSCFTRTSELFRGTTDSPQPVSYPARSRGQVGPRQAPRGTYTLSPWSPRSAHSAQTQPPNRDPEMRCVRAVRPPPGRKSWSEYRCERMGTQCIHRTETMPQERPGGSITSIPAAIRELPAR